MARFAAACLLAFCLIGSPARAQGPASQRTLDTNRATVEGRVVSTLGAPLGDAHVTVIAPPTTQRLPTIGYDAITDELGVFRIVNVPAGTYNFYARREGFLSDDLGTGRGITSITVASGERKTGLLIQLLAKSVISGRVTDQDDKPVHPEIFVVQKQYTAGRAELVESYAVTEVDADGRFRIENLDAGRYYIRVKPPTSLNSPGSELSYVNTYYPGVTDFVNAIPVELVDGRDAPEINIRLVKTRLYRVRGKVLDPPQSPEISTGEAVLQAVDATGTLDRHIVAIVDGQFEFSDVLPGRYRIQAYPISSMKDTTYEGMVVGREFVTVTGSSVDDVVIRRQLGSIITGKITPDGKSPIQDAALAALARINLIPVGSTEFQVGSPIAADGAFRFPFVAPGDYTVSLALSHRAYFKSVRLGGEDVTGRWIHIESGQNTTLEIVQSFHGAQIRGTVHDANQKSLVNIFVSAWSEGKAPDGSLDSLYTLRSNFDGEFTFTGVPPGVYSILAWEHLTNAIDGVREFRHKFMTKETTLEIKEDGNYTIDLQPISRAKSDLVAAGIP